MTSEARLPEGPGWSLRTTYQLLRAPFPALNAWKARYGETFRVRMGGKDLVITSAPEGIRALFNQAPETYAPDDVFRPLLGDRSLFVSRGAEHKTDRRLVGPMFTQGRMPGYARSIDACIQEELATWTEGSTVDLRAAIYRITFRVILATVCGAGREEATRLHAAIEALLELPGFAAMMFFPALRRRLRALTPWDRFLQRREALDGLLYGLIRARRDDGAAGADILSLLLSARFEDGTGFSDVAIRDQLLTLILAGHETVTLSICWALDHAMRSPALLARLRQELAERGDPAEPHSMSTLPLLEATLLETLRVHPTIPFVSRHLLAPMELCGYALPVGTRVAASTWLAHHRPEVFPEPERFDPERFLGRVYGPHEYLPFGGGHRRCIASSFAMYEMQLVVGTVLRAKQLTPLEPRPPPTVRINAALGPGSRMPVRVSKVA